MFNFRTEINRLRPWMRDPNRYYYEYIWKLGNRDISWTDSPKVITKYDQLKTITVEIQTSEDKLKPLLYTITYFVQTGFIKAQEDFLNLST